MADTRGISPVVGTMLLVGIVVLVSVGVAALAFGLSEPAETAPTATLEMTAGDCEHELRHTAGDPIDGNRTEFVGVEDPDALAGRTLTAGDSVQLEPTADRIELVYESGDLLGEPRGGRDAGERRAGGQRHRGRRR